MSCRNDRPHAQADWMAKVRVGDVLRMPSGKLRVVRKVSRAPNGDLMWLTFTIQRCSWTHRCTTTKRYSDVLDWEHTGAHVRLNTRMDKRIAAEVRRIDPPTMTCCAVKGVA